ncbi:MAG: hypothetical protein ACE5GX_05415 [Thermoanaerobaculia bacterium]
MSLVNEALKKARLEAARGDAAKRGVPYPALGSGSHAPGNPWIVALAAIVLLAAASGFFLYRAGKRSALEQEVAEARAPATPGDVPEAERPQMGGQPADILFEGQPAVPEPEAASEPRPRVVESVSERVPARPASPPKTPRPAARAADPPAAEPTPAPSPPPRSSAVESPPTAIEPTGAADPSPMPAGEAQSAEVALAEQEFVRRADVPGVGPVELGGIAWSGDRPFALLNGRVVRPGDSVSGLVVDQIQPNTVRLSGSAGTVVLKLK